MQPFPRFLKCLLLISLLLIPGLLSAQTEDGDIHLPESFPSAFIHVTTSEVSGNDRTKENIILRELDFSIGDSLAAFEDETPSFSLFKQKRFNKSDSSEVVQRMNYSRENIINTKLFLSVDLYLEQVEGSEYKLRIEVKERWYFWVFPVLQLDYPNFNDWLKDPDLHYLTMGVFTSHNNLFGRSHQGSLIGYGGSSQGLGLGYYIPWIGHGQKLGLRLGAIYRNSTVVEYGSLDNERQMIFDEGSLKTWDFQATLTMRPGLYNYGSVKLSASNHSISDSLYGETLDESIAPFLPEGEQSATFMNLYIEYAYDSRNNKSYPLKGNYMKGFVDKRGMGILAHDIDYFYYGADMHFYQKVSDRWYVAEMFKLVKSSSENIPYHFKQSLTSGDDFIRGYDYHSLKGDELYYFRSNLKYNLIKPNTLTPRKEKNKDSKFRNVPYAFYLNLIADVAYVKEKTYADFNPYNNVALYSWGLGLDLISYYDLVLRFEYVFTYSLDNVYNHGFFFGFGMPI